MTTEILFEYTCPECGHGTVKTTRVHNYKTKIRGYPFVVDEALIGVCDQCQAESFAPEETKRWEELFSRSLEARQAFLAPEEITELRKALGLSMEDFARLIGSTRQSISMWEKTDRTSLPIRTADLLMKLVRQSLRSEQSDVLSFLLEEAKKWGVTIEIRRSLKIFNENREDLLRNEEPGTSMNISDREKDLLGRLKIAQEKCAHLQHFPAVITEDFWKKMQKTIETEAKKPQPPQLPVLFFLLDRRDSQALSGIDQVLGFLRKSPDTRHRKDLGRLVKRLQRAAADYRDAVGAIFEAEILASLLRTNSSESVTLYPQILNSSFPEASVNLGQKIMYIEATILSQTKKQERIWEIGSENLYEQKTPTKEEIEALALSTVEDGIVTGVGDWYHDALRLVRKVHEKKKQFASQSPNVICLGLSDPDPDIISIEWGVTDVFSGNPQSAQSIKRRLETHLDNDKKMSDAETLHLKTKIKKLEKQISTFTAEPRLTGVLVFQWQKDKFLPLKAFRNPSPAPENSLSDVEWESLLRMFVFH